MKKTKFSWLFFALEILFFFVIPCFFIWLQYGEVTEVSTTKFKISVTAIVLLIVVFLCFKRVVLNKWLKGIDSKVITIESNLLSTVDETAMKASKKIWRICNIAQLGISVVIPFLVFILSIVTIKVVEQGIIKLYGALVFCLISIAVGVICRIIEILTHKCYHEGE